jgi:hypothetical protein
MFGKCEVCGEQAFVMVRDFLWATNPVSPWREYRPDGDIHRFCKTHQRKSRNREVYIDLLPPLGAASL